MLNLCIYSVSTSDSPWFNGSHIPSGSSELCRGLLDLHGVLVVFLVFVRACMMLCRSDPASCALKETRPKTTSIPSKMATSTGYHWFYIRLCHITGARFARVVALPPHQWKLQWKPGISLRAPTSSQFPKDVAAQQGRFEVWAFLFLDGIPSQVDKLHLPGTWYEALFWWDNSWENLSGYQTMSTHQWAMHITRFQGKHQHVIEMAILSRRVTHSATLG